MENMDSWDIALLAVAGYVAIAVLVRLMAEHRDQLLEQFRREMKRHRKVEKPVGQQPAQRRAG